MIAALVAIAAAAVCAVAVQAQTGIPAPGWILTVNPTANLVDGQRVVINVKANDSVSVNRVEIRECRFGPTYASNADISPDAGNCPPNAVSSSADFVVARGAAQGLTSLSHTAAGASIPYFVGQGVTSWQDGANQTVTLTCDPSNPCAFVAKVYVGDDVIFQVIKLTFAESDPLAACGGTAPGVLNTAGSDEVSDMWAGWTRAVCAATGTKAPGRAAFTGEGAAVSQFAQGNLDLAYTAAGYDDTVGLSTVAAPNRRAAIAIPLALNAAVVGVGGGEHQLVDGLPIGDKAPYPDGSVSVSAREASAMLGGGILWFTRLDKPYRGSLLARNPELFDTAIASDGNIQAPSQTLSSVYFLTNYLHTLAPDDFIDPTTSPATPRGPANSLALATPPFNSIALYTGRPALAKSVIPISLSSTDGPTWAVIDLAGARALGLTPAALESKGDFVAPTPESMTAAVAAMKPDADGVLLPDPSAAQSAQVSASDVAPYPLTYVEYALVPTEPLVDTETCTLRTDSQALLTSWLNYALGDGQKNLPDGLVALPSSLLDQAKADLAKVGTSAVTGKCAGLVTPPPTGGNGSPQPGALGGLGPSGFPTSSGLSSGTPISSTGTKLTSGLAGTTAASTSTDGKTKSPSDAVVIPAFAGHKLASSLGGVVALLGIVVLTSLGAWITAGGEFGGGITPAGLGALTPRRIGSLALLWTGVGAVGIALVMFQLGPMLEQRDQESLLKDYKAKVSQAANQAGTIEGIKTSTQPPEIGAPVGVLEIGALETQDVVVEGVGSTQTRQGPGHVPGTSGLGQPGNAVVLARRNGYGGSFAKIGTLRKGDRIVVTTTQGQSLYKVTAVCGLSIDNATSAPSSSSPAGATTSSSGDFCNRKKSGTSALSSSAPTTTTVAGATTTTSGSATTTTPSSTTTSTSTTTTTVKGGAAETGSVNLQYANATSSGAAVKTVKVDALYGPTQHDQLTLVTSAKRLPWNSNDGTVVVAKMIGKPFPPTPQGARSSTQTGLTGDSNAWPTVILCLLGFAAVIATSVLLYRKLRFRVAYVMTIAPLVAFTVITGEALARLLPAWS